MLNCLCDSFEEVKKMFHNLKNQKIRLVNMLIPVMELFGDENSGNDIAHSFWNVGVSHFNYGLTERHVALFRPALIRSLKMCFGSRFDTGVTENNYHLNHL